MLSRLDDFLIDRCAQPVADRLAARATPMGIGASLLLGSAVLEVGRIWARHLAGTNSGVDYAMGGAFLAILFALRARYVREDGAAPLGVMPAERLAGRVVRVPLLVCLPLGILWHAVLWTGSDISLPSVLSQGSYMLETAAFYFGACRRNPPKPRRQSVSVADMVPAPSA